MAARMQPPPGDGPWNTRAEAEIRYAGFRRARRLSAVDLIQLREPEGGFTVERTVAFDAGTPLPPLSPRA